MSELTDFAQSRSFVVSTCDSLGSGPWQPVLWPRCCAYWSNDLKVTIDATFVEESQLCAPQPFIKVSLAVIHSVDCDMSTLDLKDLFIDLEEVAC